MIRNEITAVRATLQRAILCEYTISFIPIHPQEYFRTYQGCLHFPQVERILNWWCRPQDMQWINCLMRLLYDNGNVDIEMHFLLHERSFIVHHHGDPVTENVFWSRQSSHYAASCLETQNHWEIFLNILKSWIDLFN